MNPENPRRHRHRYRHRYRHRRLRIGTAHASRRGYTLIECVVVLAVIAALATLCMPLIAGTTPRRAFEASAAELATDLRYVRSEAVARNSPVSIGFETGPGGSCYVIHTGATTACPCLAVAPGQAAVCSIGSGANAVKTVWLPSASAIGLASNVPSMTFDPVHGTVTPAGFVTVTGPQGLALRHVVSAMGRVRSCSPQTPGTISIPGYRPC